MLRHVLSLLLLLAAVLPNPSQAEEAVLFVTDWSNSMTGLSDDGRQLFELTPEVLDSFFRSTTQGERRPTVGLITFGNTGNSRSRADEARCEQDVTLRVGAATDFSEAQGAVMAAIGLTKASGFTPIYSAIDKATIHAVDLIESEKVDSVRIVVITDLKDTCDNASGYQEITDSYCALGKLLAARVSESRSEHGGLVKLEFVVAIGKNSGNLSILAECAEADSISVTETDEAIKAGEKIADATLVAPPPPTTVGLQVLAVSSGGDDALGRVVPEGVGEVVFLERGTTGSITSAVGETITREKGTRGSVDLVLSVGVTDSAIEIAFDGDGFVEVPWRLPMAELELRTADGAALSGEATVILRALGRTEELTAAMSGKQQWSLLPGDYEVVVGFPEGLWEKRQFRIENNKVTQSLILVEPRGDAVVSWTAPTGEARALPGPLSVMIDGGSGAPITVPFGSGKASMTGPAGGMAKVDLLRENAVVWSGDVRLDATSTSKLMVRGGLVWVTARGDRQSEWRIVDRTGDTPVRTRFQGDVFAQALPPGNYTLFLNGSPVCDEGESFQLDIGKPVDFGSFPTWSKSACQ